jgi:hypothetical protein
MHKKILFCLAVFALCMTSLSASVPFKKGQKAYVSVKSASLKAGTGAFAKNTAVVGYGDAVIILSCNSKKAEVQLASDPAKKGWIANGSLTRKKIVRNSGGSSVRASTDELALAGKGFSEAAENAFKSANRNADYTDVDKLEKITVSESEAASFIAEGKLSGGAE